MGLEEAFKVIIDKINENFKDGLYGVNDAGVIVNSISVIGKALSVVKQSEQTDTVSDVCNNNCDSKEECTNECVDEIVNLPELN